MAEPPHKRIQVLGSRGDSKRKGMDHYPVLDKQITLDHNRVQSTFPAHLTDIDLDLLTLVGSIGYADRIVERRRGTCWARRLELHVPVFRIEHWTRSPVERALMRCLRLLTGDDWHVEFYKLGRRRELQPRLADSHLFEGVACVVPYSGGLDSLAGLQLWQAGNPKQAALRIGTETNRSVGHVIRKTSEQWSYIHQVSVPLKMSPGPHAESTYRTRTFLFFTTAALAAKLAGVPKVLVMENGQGSLGPSLVPLGDEVPYRSTHPLFTRALRDLLEVVWDGEAPQFEHPHLWKTKAQVLREAASKFGTETWDETRSCSRSLRRQPKKWKDPNAEHPHSCGLCGGCLLRRSSLVAAGLGRHEHPDTFAWNRLSSTSPQSATKLVFDELERNIAVTNILNMKSLAQLASDPSNPAVLRVASEVARSQGIDGKFALGRLRQLIRQHAEDWNRFLSHLGRKAWVNQLGRVRP